MRDGRLHAAAAAGIGCVQGEQIGHGWLPVDHADGLVRVSTIHTHYHTPVSSTGAGVLVLQAAWRRGDAR